MMKEKKEEGREERRRRGGGVDSTRTDERTLLTQTGGGEPIKNEKKEKKKKREKKRADAERKKKRGGEHGRLPAGGPPVGWGKKESGRLLTRAARGGLFDLFLLRVQTLRVNNELDSHPIISCKKENFFYILW